jgi:hypothetical protein
MDLMNALLRKLATERERAMKMEQEIERAIDRITDSALNVNCILLYGDGHDVPGGPIDYQAHVICNRYEHAVQQWQYWQRRALGHNDQLATIKEPSK